MKTKSTVRIALIGAGFIGKLYARICKQMEGVELVAVCDIVPGKATELANELNAAAYPSGDYKYMLQTQPNIDAVLVCTNEESHRGPVITALEANKHVLVEKPLATQTADARAIVEVARHKPDVVSMMAYTLRFDPRYVEMKRTVMRGDIGDLGHIYARRTPPRAAVERIGGRVELPFWVGVHDIDMMRWVVSSEVVKVFAVSSAPVQGYPSVKSAILSLLTFNNGIVAILENAWGPPSTSRGQRSAAAFRVQGSKGTVEIRSDAGLSIFIGDEAVSTDTIYNRDFYGHIAGAYTDQISYFISCIREERRPEARLEDGLEGVRVAEAILQSANSGGEIVRPE